MDYSTKKTLLNHQIFMEKLLANPEFFLEILKWKDQLRLTKKDLGDFFDTDQSTYWKARKYGIKLMEQVIADKNTDFINWLNGFIKIFSLNRNWEQSIIDYIACGYYCPPHRSVHTHTDKDRGIVIVEIEPGTTKEDFEKAWQEIENRLKDLPKRDSRKFSSKSFKNLELALRANKIKREEGLGGLGLIARLYEDHEDDSEESDRRRRKKLKIIQQRLKKRGYIK